jgi:NADH:ubiquinone oxidoreductase subunit 5 (subunit L)/multisubunit Na+/H+ antiporter MnhA subunit
MKAVLELLILWPFVSFFISLLLPKNNERLISGFVFTSMATHLFSLIGFVVFWATKGFPTINLMEFFVYKGHSLHFFIDFYFDGITAVYALTGAMLAFLVATYSRIYLHREAGYKRFYNSKMLFYAGYTLTIFGKY